MRLLGRANWWAPRPLRRLYARHGIQRRFGPNGPGFPSNRILIRPGGAVALATARQAFPGGYSSHAARDREAVAASPHEE